MQVASGQAALSTRTSGRHGCSGKRLDKSDLKCVYAPKDVEFAASDMSLLAASCIFADESVFMEVLIQHRGDVKFEASTRDHRVICDQPAGNGGSDSGMTPPEYLLVSLGTCAGFYAAQYLRVRSLGYQGLEVKVSAEKTTQPARLGQFRIEVIVPGLDAQHSSGVLRAVKACLIHNTLIHAPAIETLVSTPVESLPG